jgi:2-methylcitrate dehydratase PrpD
MQAHVEGSVALPLQIAAAARAAVTAVDLVAAGLTGPHDALEGPFGYFTLFDAGLIERYSATVGTGWRIAEISVKPWPSGRASHATLGVLADLAADGLTAARVAAIEARVPPLIHRLVGRPWAEAMTPAYARLCLPLLSALMLTEGRIDPRRFEPGTFADPNLRAIGDRLTVIVDANGDLNALAPQTIRVTTTDGRVIERTIPATPGHPANALSADATAAKLRFARSLAVGPVDPAMTRDPLAYLSGAPG